MFSAIFVKVRGIIIKNGAVLLSEFDDESGLHYNLPGGTVEQGEALHDALVREIWEETGWRVRVGNLLYVWEYVPQQRNFFYGDQASVTLCFTCETCEDTGKSSLDPNQIGSRWVALSDLPQVALLPPEIIPYIVAQETGQATCFLGQI